MLYKNVLKANTILAVYLEFLLEWTYLSQALQRTQEFVFCHVEYYYITYYCNIKTSLNTLLLICLTPKQSSDII